MSSTSETFTYTIDIEEGTFIVQVRITAERDDGVHTYRNGDPGYPASEDREYKIISVTEGDGRIYSDHPAWNAIDSEVSDRVDDEQLDYD